MCVCAQIILLAALPALVGRAGWCADGEVVSVTEASAGAGATGPLGPLLGPTGPSFAPRQRTGVVAAVGQAASLDCRVLRLRDKSVSWVRSRDLQILTHAGTVFTADARVSASVGGGGAGGGSLASRHSLRIERLRVSDAGRYECQVNTEPKMSLFFNLTVLDEPVPEVVVEARGPPGPGAGVGAEAVVVGVAGGVASLSCEARYEPAPRALPVPPLDIRWFRGGRLIDLQSGAQGGVSLETQRWGTRSEATLTLAQLAPADAGEYRCAAAGRNATLRLRLTSAQEGVEGAEAMQRDAAPASAAAPAPARRPPMLFWLLLPRLLRLLAT